MAVPERVVISGAGCCTALGHNLDSVARSLREGRDAFRASGALEGLSVCPAEDWGQDGARQQLEEAHNGETQTVRAKGRTGGEHPQPRIPSQTGRPHRGLPALPFIFRKFPQKPDMAELLQPPDRVRIPEFRFKNDPSLQILHQSALPGDPEFFREIRMDMRDRLNLIHLFFRSFPAASDLPVRK